MRRLRVCQQEQEKQFLYGRAAVWEVVHGLRDGRRRTQKFADYLSSSMEEEAEQEKLQE